MNTILPPAPHRLESSPTVRIDRAEIARRLRESGWPATDADLDGATSAGTIGEALEQVAATIEAAAYSAPLGEDGRVVAHASRALEARCACGQEACPACARRM